MVVVESAIESHGGCPRCDSSICLVGFSLKPRMQKGDWHFRKAPASAESNASHRRNVSGEAFRIGGCASKVVESQRCGSSGYSSRIRKGFESDARVVESQKCGLSGYWSPTQSSRDADSA